MRLLDLYCGGGGAGVGYARAGFDVVGVDLNPQPHYPYASVQADALEYALEHGREFDAIHASPPCQAYTRKQANWGRARTHYPEHPDLLEPTRALLEELGIPYVIENVPGAPIRASMLLCGTMLGLRISKHRLFEAGRWELPILAPGTCDHRGAYSPWRGAGRTAEQFRDAMGIDWLPTGGGASRKRGSTGDLSNAIPPAYTEWIGTHLMAAL